jgi:hypothetical protein
MKLLIVGKSIDDQKGWEFQGVFDSATLAIESCRTEHYFIGPAELNEVLPDESSGWAGAWYPKLEAEPKSSAAPSVPSV